MAATTEPSSERLPEAEEEEGHHETNTDKDIDNDEVVETGSRHTPSFSASGRIVNPDSFELQTVSFYVFIQHHLTSHKRI